jgi:RHH-type proline utilization regulon transcriptional repressor/proline dehydrogenase/delta 1-pyrroline-5-carboxylate dehydrogenase
MPLPADLPVGVRASFSEKTMAPHVAALVEGDATVVAKMVARVAEMPGPIVSVHAAQMDQALAYQCDWLLEEVSTSINTTAAGGNASLMMIG